ncbi:GntR family transcriptional regulator [Demequina lignilytica]|uniref:GntR family transcriptional regulator n=1 Tax=Demequina lignilytica TaxID=3051663 RepID=A0AB35MF99_9MICO|nr:MULTISPECIES: GntR family transcriptional regulator [unclassified Demequina]MDN4482457.1 GntR family transcriptional regulator [Demequina sp. SYSU T0a273]MDN4489821.1 GntR family transcriptional regulator [Demequina sp. SYSU T00068]
MLLRIDPAAGAPLYDQIAASIRADAATGALVEGDRLPSAREVAESLDVNLHTVLKAYQMLRDEGLVEMRRGRGAVIGAAAASLADLRADAQALAARARELGVGPEALAALVRAAAQES